MVTTRLSDHATFFRLRLGTNLYEVAYLANALDLGGYLAGRFFGLVGIRRASKLGDPVVDLDVYAGHIFCPLVLTDPGADALLDLGLIFRYTFDVVVVIRADKGTGRRDQNAPAGSRYLRSHRPTAAPWCR